MRHYLITLPRGERVDVFNLPENFKEVVETTFREYTEGTAKDYRECDKLAFIDCFIKHINNCEESYEVINRLVKERFEYEWEENRSLITEGDIYNTEFMEYCYQEGQRTARLYSHYGIDDHHIYNQIQKVLVKVITIVMNYEE